MKQQEEKKDTEQVNRSATKRKIKNHKFGQHVFYKLKRENEWKRMK